MWEDNNPLAYDDDSPTADHFPGYSPSPPASPDSDDGGHLPFSSVRSPISEPSRPEYLRSDSSNEPHGGRRLLSKDDEEDEEYRNARRAQGYSSRVEQMLLEKDSVPITITDAGKNHEGSGGGYIVYTIRTGVRCPAPAGLFRWNAVHCFVLT